MASSPDASELAATVAALYVALAAGHADAVLARLDPAFTARFADGMPAGAGEHHGATTALREGWWAIGRAFRARAEPDEWVPCADGRLLVLGRYRGSARDGGVVDASFAHLWTAGADGRLVALRQETDTARWGAATAPRELRPR